MKQAKEFYKSKCGLDNLRTQERRIKEQIQQAELLHQKIIDSLVSAVPKDRVSHYLVDCDQLLTVDQGSITIQQIVNCEDK